MARIVPESKTSRSMLLASVCIVVAALYFAQAVLIPLALSVLLSFLIAPIVNRLERWKVSRVPAVLIAVTLVFGVIGVLGSIVVSQLYDLAKNVDEYEGNVLAKVEGMHPRSALLEKWEHAANVVQQRMDGATTGPATTQSTQPAGAAANESQAGVPQAVQEKFDTVKEGVKGAAGDDSVLDHRTAATGGAWTLEHPLPVQQVIKQSPLEVLGKYLALALSPLGTAGLVLVFVVFILLQREDLRNRVIRLTSRGQLTVATQALDDASERISRYLTAQAMVNGSYGIAISAGLWIIGLTLGRADASGTMNFPNIVLWGLLCAVMRFIPYIGPWIALSFPLLISLAVYKGFGVFVATGMLFIGIELITNNVMEPWLYGSSTGMSTVAILVSAVFWTWLWGPIGLLLATPMTVVLMVLGKYVPQLQFLEVMLGDEPVLDPPAGVYQRLLALDAEDATEMMADFRNEMSLEEVYDKVLLPALFMAERDRTRGLLDDRKQKFIRRTVRDIIEEMGDQESARAAADKATAKEAQADGAVLDDAAAAKAPSVPARGRKLPSDCKINIICLPAHDEADEIVNLMLAQLLEMRGYIAFSGSQNALASEMIQEIADRQADVVVISALPPGAVNHARYLCKRVHAEYPEAKIAVGLWGYEGNLERAKERMTSIASVPVVTLLADMQDQVDDLSQPARVREMPAG